MDIMSVIGILGSAALLIYGILDGGSIENFINSSSAAITVGGTVAALMITFPMKVFAAMPKLLLKIFLPGEYNPVKYVTDIVEISTDAKKNGMLYVEEKIPHYKDSFLCKALTLAVDSTAPEEIRHTMETELGYMIERHKSGVRFFEKGAVLAPGFGMIGTLTGLINMLMQTEDPTGITHGMASALITTFYGLIMANVIFLPMGNKLRKRSDEEVLCKQIIIEGVVSIANGETPKQIQEKLDSYIPPSMRKFDKINKSKLRRRNRADRANEIDEIEEDV